MVKPFIIGTSNARDMLREGVEVLRGGGSAMDAVEATIRAVEENPLDTGVGLGGIPNLLGVPQLDASQRKAVAACTERRRGQDYQHLGGHLGALVRTWLEREALIAKTATGLAVTDHGRKSLIEAGWLDHTLP